MLVLASAPHAVELRPMERSRVRLPGVMRSLDDDPIVYSARTRCSRELLGPSLRDRVALASYTPTKTRASLVRHGDVRNRAKSLDIALASRHTSPRRAGRSKYLTSTPRSVREAAVADAAPDRKHSPCPVSVSTIVSRRRREWFWPTVEWGRGARGPSQCRGRPVELPVGNERALRAPSP